MTSQLIQAVEQASSALGLLQATQALAAVEDPAAASCLVEVLGFNNPGAAVAAVDGLIRLGPQAVEPILDCLDPRNYGARAWAVRALAGIGDVRGLEVLEEALATDVGPSVRRAAACGLGQLRLEALMEQERRDGEWVVRYGVVFGLEALALLVEPMGDPHQRARRALASLSQAPAEETPVVRLRAALALRRLEA
jgi:phycocyanobilin lyase beta subunit